MGHPVLTIRKLLIKIRKSKSVQFSNVFLLRLSVIKSARARHLDEYLWEIAVSAENMIFNQLAKAPKIIEISILLTATI